MNKAIRIERLSKVFKGDLGKKPVTAVDSFDLEVQTGEVFAFLGPNGAGKTTSIKLIMRLLRPTTGKIELFGRSNRSSNVMETVGFLPEQPSLYVHLTGLEFLDFIARLFQIPSAERKKRIGSLIERVGLTDRADSRIGSYSRGMLQRLGMAQALINDPRLIIMDEPMSNLDPIGRKEFRDLILELKKDGKTVFISSHILQDAEMIADRVGILNHGKMVKIGGLDDLIGSQSSSVEVLFEFDANRESAIRQSSYHPLIQGKKAWVLLPDSREIPALLKAIESWQGLLISCTPERRSLEDVFMTEIMG